LRDDSGSPEGDAGQPAQARSRVPCPRTRPADEVRHRLFGGRDWGFTTIANAAWAHTVGVFCLAFIVAAFLAALPPDLLPSPHQKPERSEKGPAVMGPRCEELHQCRTGATSLDDG
jgi:hypothetical protein